MAVKLLVRLYIDKFVTLRRNTAHATRVRGDVIHATTNRLHNSALNIVECPQELFLCDNKQDRQESNILSLIHRQQRISSKSQKRPFQHPSCRLEHCDLKSGAAFYATALMLDMRHILA